jgi:diguanylate cyclase
MPHDAAAHAPVTDSLTSIIATLAIALPSALLLWLGASLAAHTRGQADGAQPPMLIVALGVATTGLWWPLHEAIDLAAGPGPSALLVQLTAMVMLTMALLLGRAVMVGPGPWLSHWRFANGAAAIAVSVAIVLGASLALNADLWTAVVRGLLGGALLSLAIAAMGWTTGEPLAGRERLTYALRAGAAALAAATLTFVAAMGQTEVQPWAHVSAMPMLGMAMVGLAMLHLLRQGTLRARAQTRRAGDQAAPTEDPLTGLMTRTTFETRLTDAVVRCDAGRTRMALLFVDLDGFKPVNDSYGHACGDQVLRQVGQRLRATVSKGRDMVARVGGDEFLMLMVVDGSRETSAKRADEVVQAVSRPYEVDGREVRISCSIGIALYPDQVSGGKLIARADAAMYAAKRAGGAGYAFFAPEMEDDARDRFDLLRDLREALQRNELELFYQPKIDAKSGKVTAAEALLRWRHPTRGMVGPATFIPIAERHGLMRELGDWVIEDACRQARVWRDKGLRMRVAINLSAMQMRQEDIVARIEGALLRHRVDPAQLTCEITESVAMEDTRATQETFRELGAAGIHLSIDDFGTGYSSLAYLRKLPAEELKIDRSFITDIEHSADARAVVDAVVKLAHALGLNVVAEGVENERQRDILADLGCDELQGFLFAKPMSARALLLWAIEDRHAPQREHFATSLFGSTIRRLTEIEPERPKALH